MTAESVATPNEIPALDLDAVNDLLEHDPVAAATLLTEAARADRADAQAWLAQLYMDGRGVPRDESESLYWFQRAAHAGVPMAINMLGRCYENGWGSPVDYELAAVWYRRGAEAGLDWAVYNYAQMLAHGRGMPKNRDEARRWFERAAALGHARAKHFLGQYYDYGLGIPIDKARAVTLYRESAAAGDYRGLCSWASILVTQHRLDEALTCLREAIPLAPKHYLPYLSAQLLAADEPALRQLGLNLAAPITGESPRHTGVCSG